MKDRTPGHEPPGQELSWPSLLNLYKSSADVLQSNVDQLRMTAEHIGFLGPEASLHFRLYGEEWCPDVIQQFPLFRKLQLLLPKCTVSFVDSTPQEIGDYLCSMNPHSKKEIPFIQISGHDGSSLAALQGRSPEARSWMLTRLNGRSPKSIPPDEKSIILGEFYRAYNEGLFLHTLESIRNSLSITFQEP